MDPAARLSNPHNPRSVPELPQSPSGAISRLSDRAFHYIGYAVRFVSVHRVMRQRRRGPAFRLRAAA